MINGYCLFHVSLGDVDMLLLEFDTKTAIRMLSGNFSESEALETLDFIPPIQNQYIIVACSMTCATQLLEQVHRPLIYF